MKWIKRLFAAVGILFLLLIVAAILIPVLFKDKIEKAVKEQVNANLNATVDWGEWDLTIISSFPNAGFEVKNVKVCNVAPFEGICLADIGELKATVGLMSLFGEKIVIKRVALDHPVIHVKVLKDGRANWAGSDGVQWYFGVTPEKKLTFYGGTIVSSSISISADTWHHLAAIRSGNTLTLYIDGQSAGS